jgi:hypothetical protein
MQRVLWAFLAVSLLLAGCSFGSSSDPPAEEGLKSIPPSQRLILADGSVSRAEIEQAYADSVACLEQAGFADVSWSRDSERVYSIQATLGPPRPGESAADAELRADNAFDDCRTQYVSVVSDEWLRATELSDEEKRAAAEVLASCVAPFGIEVTGFREADLKPLIDRLAELDRNMETNDTESIALNECFSVFALKAGSSPG